MGTFKVTEALQATEVPQAIALEPDSYRYRIVSGDFHAARHQKFSQCFFLLALGMVECTCVPKQQCAYRPAMHVS